MTQLNDKINFLSTELSRHRRSLGSHSPHALKCSVYMVTGYEAPVKEYLARLNRRDHRECTVI